MKGDPSLNEIIRCQGFILYRYCDIASDMEMLFIFWVTFGLKSKLFSFASHVFFSHWTLRGDLSLHMLISFRIIILCIAVGLGVGMWSSLLLVDNVSVLNGRLYEKGISSSYADSSLRYYPVKFLLGNLSVRKWFISKWITKIMPHKNNSHQFLLCFANSGSRFIIQMTYILPALISNSFCLLWRIDVHCISLTVSNH